MPKIYQYSQAELDYVKRRALFTDRERKVFTLFYLRGMSINDVADKIQHSRATVCRDLAKIRAKICERLKNYNSN